MAITSGQAEYYFGNTINEAENGTTYMVHYIVRLFGFETASAKERSQSQLIAKRASGVPQYGDQYEGDVNAFARGISVATIGGEDKNIPTKAIVSVTFSTIPTEDRDEEENPLNKRPDSSWTTVFEREVVLNAWRRQIFQNGGMIGQVLDAGIIGNVFNNFNLFKIGIKNSANEPFNPIPEKDVPYPMVTIVRNVPSAAWDPLTQSQFVGTINVEDIKVDGADIKKENALCLENSSRLFYQGKDSFREITTSLLLKNSHDLQIQDKGFKVLKKPDGGGSTGFGGGSGGFKPTVAKVDGEDTPVEVLLDGNGNILPENAKPVYIHYAIFQTANHTQLGLPQEKL